VYVLDGFWTPEHDAAPTPAELGPLAREWYAVALADAQAVLLGVFAWGPEPPGVQTSRDLPCAVLQEHARIGRLLTGKRGAAVCGAR
jgi:hypothetical protein